MSRIILITLIACAFAQASYAQSTPNNVQYVYNNGHTFLYQRFGNFESKALRLVIARMSLYGDSELGEYRFERAGVYQDRIKITRKNREGGVLFQLEISESTFLYFINDKEERQEEERYNRKPIMFTSIK